MKGTCPLADPDSRPVCVDVPGSRTVYVSGGIYEFKTAYSRCFTVEPHAEFDVILPLPEEQQQVSEPGASSIVEPEVPALYAERSLTGHGAERGGVQTIFTNPSPDEEVEFVYMETLPWFMRIYLHTLQARVASGGPVSSLDGKVIQEIYYRPARDRARGTQLEVRLRVPPASTMFLTYDFEKSILRYTEYPPDANRGFDVAAAVITILRGGRNTTTSAITTDSTKRRATLRTASLLLSLPTPDFSMPYNVIIFTSTCIALAFGGMFNILVRRFVAADEGPELGLGSAVQKIKERLRAKFGKGAASSNEAQLVDETTAPELEPERAEGDST